MSIITVITSKVEFQIIPDHMIITTNRNSIRNPFVLTHNVRGASKSIFLGSKRGTVCICE